jgi:transketolase
MTAEAGSGHYMSSLSNVEILVSLYYKELNHYPEYPKHPDRDRFVLSKGHAAPTLYAILAETGYFPIEELKTFRKFGSRLQGHPDSQMLPGVDTSSGSLGQGLSIAVGIAFAGKLDKKDYQVFTLLGDGECQEGQVWEAAMAGAHFKLDNLIAIIDNNALQSSGKVEEIMSLGNIKDKWESFGWKVFEVNGHDFTSLLTAFKEAREIKNKPTIIIANTVKGYGIPFIEGNLYYHTAPLNKEELKHALELIG